jgi:hypothetical protein
VIFVRIVVGRKIEKIAVRSLFGSMAFLRKIGGNDRNYKHTRWLKPKQLDYTPPRKFGRDKKCFRISQQGPIKVSTTTVFLWRKVLWKEPLLRVCQMKNETRRGR